MAHQIGSYTLPVNPDAESYEVSSVSLASMVRALDGSAVTHYVADKLRWSGHWPGLTATQRDSIMTQLRAQEHIAWYPPEEPNTEYTVRVLSASWKPTSGASEYFDVYFELEEV